MRLFAIELRVNLKCTFELNVLGLGTGASYRFMYCEYGTSAPFLLFESNSKMF